MVHAVQQIWRYPVKSIQGESLESAVVTDLGIEHDRGWGVRDVRSGTVLTGRREPKLLLASASVRDGELSITTDTDVVIRGAAIGDRLAAMSQALSAWLDREVQLVAAGDQGGTYEVPLDLDTENDWVSWTGPGGAWHDSTRTRVSLLSSATCGTIEPQRFRANLILDGAADGEDDWVDHTVRVGDSTRLDVVKRIDRCIMVARPLPGHDADLDALKWVIRERENRIGVGALVSDPGTIAVGDPIRYFSEI